jgi:MoxR-like ATPase
MPNAAVTTPTPDALLAAASRLRDEVSRRIVGQREVLDEILMAILAGGHALLVGVPGLAKTLMIRSVADAMELDFRRIQFTPDLVPSDITGTEILEENASGGRTFRFVRGPVFANIVLADEINRAPPRTQAALLEAMQEHRVTAAGETMLLPEPFFVLATQNPIGFRKRSSTDSSSIFGLDIPTKARRSRFCARPQVEGMLMFPQCCRVRRRYSCNE